MKIAIEVLAFIGFVCGFVALCMCAAAAKRQPKPGEDYDERGPYDVAVDQVQSNVSFDFRKFLRKLKP